MFATMKKKFRLKRKKDIELLLKIKKSVGNKYYAIYFNLEEDTKIAVSVSKKLGKAVERNYQKRVTREIISKNMQKLEKVHALIVVKKPSMDLSFTEKQKQLEYLILKVKK